MTSDNIVWYLSKKLDVLYRRIQRGSLLRRDMEDMDNKDWICVNGKVPAYSIK